MAGSRRTFFPVPEGFVPWWRLGRPQDWAQLFGRPGPVELEIGPGTGERLAREAGAHPDRNYLGVELQWGRLARALERCGRAGCRNVRGTLADARFVLHRVAPPRSLDRVVALFLDPWPKDRHEGRRLFGRPFQELVASRLRDGGEVYLVTDHGPYADWVCEQARGGPLRAERREIRPGFGTRFEEKWVGGGQERFHEIRLVKERHPEVPVPEEVEVIQVPVSGFDPDRFAPRTVRGEATVAFKEVVHDPGRAKALVRAVVVEPLLEQQLWIEVVRERKGWRVSPAEGCAFVPTPGLRAALEEVARAADESAAAGNLQDPGAAGR